MPRKTGYKTRSASSTLILGNPDVGTKNWDTEYDVEFSEVPRREAQERLDEAKASARAALRTPRSLKKGYVSGQDYENLDEQYGQALSAYRNLQAQVGALETRMTSMKTNEQQLLQSVEEQQGLLETLRGQVAAMTQSLGLLLGGAERNRSLLALMTNVQQGGAPLSRPRRLSEVEGGPQAESAAAIAQRLSALEAKIGDMADAVAALARAQALMASPRPFSPAGRHSGPEGGGVGPGRQGGVGRESVHSGRRRALEKIERLPNPIQIATRGSTWKP